MFSKTSYLKKFLSVGPLHFFLFWPCFLYILPTESFQVSLVFVSSVSLWSSWSVVLIFPTYYRPFYFCDQTTWVYISWSDSNLIYPVYPFILVAPFSFLYYSISIVWILLLCLHVDARVSDLNVWLICISIYTLFGTFLLTISFAACCQFVCFLRTQMCNKNVKKNLTSIFANQIILF